jgi:PhzF family phenazine biosynthesis protein
MKKYRIYQIDAFTRELFRGNPAGVVPEADGLTDEQMQDVARELGNSETAFIFPAEANDHDFLVRFFTPSTEVPICGHATIAVNYVRALENNLPSAVVRQKSRIGILPIEIIKNGADYSIIMTQVRPTFTGPIEKAERQILLNALQITENEMDGRCPLQIVSTGHGKLIVGLKSRHVLNRLEPEQNLLKGLGRKLQTSFFVFTFDSDRPEVLTHARMFAPAIGISEDPVTGNGNGPLGAYLVHNKLVSHDGQFFEFTSQQGEAMRRTGRVKVMVDIENDEPVRVRIRGEAVVAFQTEIEI